MKLREITADYESIMLQVEAAEGELTPEMAQQLEINNSNKVEKVEGYVAFIHDQEAFIARIDEEVKRLTAMKKTTANRVGYLKCNLLNAVIMLGDIDLPFNKVSIRESKAVSIIDEAAIPDEFWVEKTTRSVSKTAIKKAIDAGDTVTGAMIVTNENLQIK